MSHSVIAEEAIKQADRELAEGKITAEELSKRIGEDAAAIGQKYGERLAAEKGEAIFNELVAKFHNHYEPVPNSLVGFAKGWGMSRTVEDLQLVIEKAKALGGKTLVGPITIPAGTFAWMQDPEGNTIGLWKAA